MKIWLLNIMMLCTVGLLAQNKVGNFTQIEIDGPVIIKLVAAEANNVSVEKEADLVNWEINGDALVIMARYRKGRETPEVRVSIAQLESLETTGSVIINGEGVFANRKIEMTITSQSIVELEVDAEELVVEADSQSIVNVSGSADALELSLNSQSIVNADKIRSAMIYVTANHQSIANINSNGAKLTKEVHNQSLVVE